MRQGAHPIATVLSGLAAAAAVVLAGYLAWFGFWVLTVEGDSAATTLNYVVVEALCVLAVGCFLVAAFSSLRYLRGGGFSWALTAGGYLGGFIAGAFALLGYLAYLSGG